MKERKLDYICKQSGIHSQTNTPPTVCRHEPKSLQEKVVAVGEGGSNSKKNAKLQRTVSSKTIGMLSRQLLRFVFCLTVQRIGKGKFVSLGSAGVISLDPE